MATGGEAKLAIGAVDQTKAAFESAKRNLSSLADKADAIKTRMGSLGLAIGAAFSAGSIMGLVDMLDQLDDMAEKTGISTEKLSALRYAGETVGTTTEQMATGLRKLAKTMADAAGGNDQAIATFKAMGVEIFNTDGTLRATDKVLEDVAQRFSGFNDGPEKAALAMRVFSKSGEDMIPMLNLGKAGLQSMSTEAKALGAVLGADVAKNAADFNDHLKKIKLASEAAAVSITGPLVKALADLSGAFIESRKQGEGYFQMLQRATTLLPQLPNSGVGGALVNVLPGGQTLRLLQQYGAALNAPMSTSQIQSYVNRLGASAGAGRGLVNPKVAAPIVPDKSNPKAPDHFADNFINQLITEYANLSGNMSKTDEVTRKLDTSTEKFTGTQRRLALEYAGLIDAEKRRADEVDQIARLQGIQIDAQQKLDAEYYAAIGSLEKLAEAEAFELSLMGKQPDVVDRARFARDLSNQVRTAEAALLSRALQAGWDENRMLQERARITREATDAQEAFDKRQADELDKHYNPARGMSDAAKDYLDGIAKIGDETNKVVSGAFKSMEDAMVSFATTGKLDFKSLANSIIADIVRIQVRQNITGPLAASIGGGGGGWGSIFSSIFGTSGSSGGGISGLGHEFPVLGYAGGGVPPVGKPYWVGENGPEIRVDHSPGTIIPSRAMGGATYVSSPVINVQGGMNRAEVYSVVNTALQQNNHMWSDHLRAQGVLQ